MHKRHLRWIAALAIAGTGVLGSAAAAAAAASLTDQPKPASPGTCAALNADLSTSVGAAVKALAPARPNLAGASADLSDATALTAAIKSLHCTLAPIVLPAPPAGSATGTSSTTTGVQGTGTTTVSTGTQGDVTSTAAGGATDAQGGVTSTVPSGSAGIVPTSGLGALGTLPGGSANLTSPGGSAGGQSITS